MSGGGRGGESLVKAQAMRAYWNGRITQDSSSTHYDGCEQGHKLCAISTCYRAIDELTAERDHWKHLACDPQTRGNLNAEWLQRAEKAEAERDQLSRLLGSSDTDRDKACAMVTTLRDEVAQLKTALTDSLEAFVGKHRKVMRYAEALTQIASYDEAAVVSGSMDEPYAAAIAREAPEPVAGDSKP